MEYFNYVAEVNENVLKSDTCLEFSEKMKFRKFQTRFHQCEGEQKL